jgi:hypothetical protein
LPDSPIAIRRCSICQTASRAAQTLSNASINPISNSVKAADAARRQLRLMQGKVSLNSVAASLFKSIVTHPPIEIRFCRQ